MVPAHLEGVPPLLLLAVLMAGQLLGAPRRSHMYVALLLAMHLLQPAGKVLSAPGQRSCGTSTRQTGCMNSPPNQVFCTGPALKSQSIPGKLGADGMGCIAGCVEGLPFAGSIGRPIWSCWAAGKDILKRTGRSGNCALLPLLVSPFAYEPSCLSSTCFHRHIAQAHVKEERC